MLKRLNASARPPARRLVRRAALLAAAVLLTALAAGCATTSVAEPESALPDAAALPGWTAEGAVQTFDHKTLFDYIDGASEYFFTYSFEKVATRQYKNTGGSEMVVEIWRFAKSADAFGLFSGRTGLAAVTVGRAAGALLETGSRLYFWQNRFYVVLTATTSLSDGDLKSVAELISNRLPAGGTQPALIGKLPAENFVPDSGKFFHSELAIQDQLWLGGENLLGLGPDTDAVFGLYQAGSNQMELLLVQYPDAKRAATGLAALKGGGLEELLVSDANGSLLGAVFGQASAADATALLAKAVGK